MSNDIFCKKLQKEAPQLDSPPYPGPLGDKIYEQISEPGWAMWLQHQTMLINEYRLNMLDAEVRKFLETQMESFFFGFGFQDFNKGIFDVYA